MFADPLVKLKIQPSQRGAILELGLVVDVGCSEAVDLDAACDLLSLHTFVNSPFVALTTSRLELPMCSAGETKATDLPSREDWMAVATEPDVEP